MRIYLGTKWAPKFPCPPILATLYWSLSVEVEEFFFIALIIYDYLWLLDECLFPFLEYVLIIFHASEHRAATY